MKSSFCKIPWEGLTVDTWGQPRACCEAGPIGPEDSYVDDQGRALNIRDHSFEEIRNSPLFRRIRMQMLDGERPAVCGKCWTDEDAGIASLRQVRGLISATELNEDQARAGTDSLGRIDPAALPFIPEIRLSNQCNLKCRMCSPAFSNAWYEDARTLNIEAGLAESEAGPYGLKVPAGGATLALDSVFFRESMQRAIPNLRKIIFSGGEPFMQRAHYQLLESLIEGGHANRIALSYTTNLTLLPEKLFKLWAAFQSVQAVVSVEGVGKTQEYVRYPSNWTVIEKNIRTFDRVATLFGWDAMFQTTLSPYNVFAVKEWMEWFIGANLRSFLKVEFHRVSNPAHLDIRALPPTAKDHAQGSLQGAIETIERAAAALPGESERTRELKRTAADLSGVIRHMQSGELPGEWEKFGTFTRGLDRLRGQAIESFLPELATYLDSR